MRAFLLALLLAGCAHRPAVGTDQSDDVTLMILGDDEANLLAFENAARACGLTGIERVSNGSGSHWIRVSGPSKWLWSSRTNPHICASEYLDKHPSVERHYIGNSALKR
jgi:hypothetical protein